VKKLERLHFYSKRAFSGQTKGERRSIKRGSSVEFADFRDYSLGDDLRYVDWRAYARLDKLFLKLFVEEEDLSVHLLIDTSKSMDFGEPVTKAVYARRAAAALGYVALTEQDRVMVAAFAAGLGRPMPPQRGKAGLIPFFRHLEDRTPIGGGTQFGDAMTQYAAQIRNPGIAVVLSDFFDDTYERGLKALLARHMQIVLLHVLDPEELDPSITGDLRLIDSESGEKREVSMSPHVLAQYKAHLEEFTGNLKKMASRYGMDYVQISTDMPLETVMLSYLRKSGLLR
jgi:uncharacterized protein (DUF58 family)